MFFIGNLQGKIVNTFKNIMLACCRQYKLRCQSLTDAGTKRDVSPAFSIVRAVVPVSPSLFLRLWAIFALTVLRCYLSLKESNMRIYLRQNDVGTSGGVVQK